MTAPEVAFFMAQGISLHVGLNSVDPKHYGGWDGKLLACEYDARDMARLAKATKFKTRQLMSAKATSEAVINAITKAATQLKTGDLFLFTYSGHGGQVPDRNGDEPDKQDETYVLYDRQLVDDELFGLWTHFAPGVRIVVLADCCHSGTNVRARLYRGIGSNTRFRAIPDDVGERTYKQHQKLYDRIQKTNRAGEKVAVNASILLISGCQDNQLSADGDRNGLFTENLLKVWKSGAFAGSYTTFHRAIQTRMPPWQSPNLFRAGVRDHRFEAQKPFSV